MTELCVWTQMQHWPTGNDSTLFRPGCKQFKMSAVGRGWKFCPFCGGSLRGPVQDETRESTSSADGGA